jgi:hypothetical protein
LAAQTISAGSYNIYGTSYDFALLPFIISGTGPCSTVTYALTTSAGAAIDSTVFTFATSPSLKVTISTSDSNKIGTYTFLLYGSIDGRTSATTTFTITINTKCYGQSVSSSSISDGSYDVASSSTIVETFSPFSITGTGACTSITYTLTKSDGTAFDTSVFTFSPSLLTLGTSTCDTAKIGTYYFTLTGTLTGDT